MQLKDTKSQANRARLKSIDRSGRHEMSFFGLKSLESARFRTEKLTFQNDESWKTMHTNHSSGRRDFVHGTEKNAFNFKPHLTRPSLACTSFFSEDETRE